MRSHPYDSAARCVAATVSLTDLTPALPLAGLSIDLPALLLVAGSIALGALSGLLLQSIF